MKLSLFTVGLGIAAIAFMPAAAWAQDEPPPPPTAPPQYAPPPPNQPPPPPQQYQEQQQYPQQQYPQQPQYPQQQYYAPPPPQYPPQYYAPPPPPPYMVVPRPPRPPSNGVGAIIAGSILVGVGLIFIGLSIPFWGDGCGAGHSCFADPTSNDYGNAAGGLALDVVGGMIFTTGAIVLPIGIATAVRYGRMRRGQRVNAAPNGLKITF